MGTSLILMNEQEYHAAYEEAVQLIMRDPDPDTYAARRLDFLMRELEALENHRFPWLDVKSPRFGQWPEPPKR